MIFSIVLEVKMKKFLAVLLAMLLVLSLAACGSDTADTSASDTESAEASQDLLAEIQERGYIVIATEGDWSPLDLPR